MFKLYTAHLIPKGLADIVDIQRFRYFFDIKLLEYGIFLAHIGRYVEDNMLLLIVNMI